MKIQDIKMWPSFLAFGQRMLFEMQSVVLPKQRLRCFGPGKSSCICEGGLAGAN